MDRCSASLPLDDFLESVGAAAWQARIGEISRRSTTGRHAGRLALQRHAIECILERARTGRDVSRASASERRIRALATRLAQVIRALSPDGQDRMAAELRRALSGQNTLVGIFHLIRTAAVQEARGFEVSFAGLEEGAPYDLRLRRHGITAEVACDVVSAEAGRDVQRGAWFNLCDRIDHDLETWLADHPGRYLLKMTLPQGLKAACDSADGEAAAAALAKLHERIRALLARRQRADHDEAAVLRLDPLLLIAAQAGDLGLVSGLRREFGPEAHIAVTKAGGGVFALAARAGRQDEVACAIRRRMAAIAPTRLTGEHPGILAMFLEDTDADEWCGLRDRLELEGEARQFLTEPAGRGVIAVTCTSRLELFDMPAPAAVAEGELRFRNPSHPAAKSAALAPAVMSSV
jgi:hypothetical protein